MNFLNQPLLMFVERWDFRRIQPGAAVQVSSHFQQVMDAVRRHDCSSFLCPQARPGNVFFQILLLDLRLSHLLEESGNDKSSISRARSVKASDTSTLRQTCSPRSRKFLVEIFSLDRKESQDFSFRKKIFGKKNSWGKASRNRTSQNMYIFTTFILFNINLCNLRDFNLETLLNTFYSEDLIA